MCAPLVYRGAAGWVWSDSSVCRICQQVVTPSEAPQPPVIAERDQYSSYDTGESEDDAAEDIQTHSASASWIDTLSDIKRCIASVDATQNAIVNKLGLLEKCVACVQEDVAGMRSDVEAVYEIVDSLADHVSLLKNTVAVVEGLPDHRSPEVSAWGPWPDAVFEEDHDIAETTAVAEDDMDQLGDEDNSHVNAIYGLQGAIPETQLFDMNTTLVPNRMSQEEDGGGEGWVGKTGSRSVRGSPKENFTLAEGEADFLETLGGQQMELTLESTQTGTQIPGRSAWSDYTSSVRNMAAPTFGGGDSSPGCVRSKRARGSNSTMVPRDTAETGVVEMAHHRGLNLNLSPGVPGAPCGLSGRGRSAAGPGRGPGSRGGARGGGRGAGRVKRPEAVQPRYATTASGPNMSNVVGRCLIHCIYIFAVLWKTTCLLLEMAGVAPSWSAMLGGASWLWNQTGCGGNCWRRPTFESHRR